MTPVFNFTQLIEQISLLNREFSNQVSRAINVSLTLRNWYIGGYLHKYELKGSDRATYGDQLMQKLAKSLKQSGLGRISPRELRRYRQFYLTYPQIGESAGYVLKNDVSLTLPEKRESVTPISGKELINNLSFTHICELLSIEDGLKRAFYEVEAIQGNWSVRELRRQIHSLYYERSALSLNKEKLAQLANRDIEQKSLGLTIRDPYVFEFLGLTPQEVMSESHLEQKLLEQLEDFLLELGNGFCFEARQQRILIGEAYYFIDLVFYHRVLKCHVLIELKLAEFNHENIGQLNTYVSWYKQNMMRSDDNPPIGILLCTHKDQALVKYALAGMDDNLFISKYQLELPSKEEMERFIVERVNRDQ
ncbi:MAG: DUF1016 domain-containing protein [Spirulina sp. SIO3F2]|nr:DUF1016 domain-containing protein [Spirulina sp. SIO3F2]